MREGHVAVVAPDYELNLRSLLDAGFELRAGSNAWDAPRAFVRDPAGNLIEVMSAPPLPPFPAA
jgi:catechol 2,3-dioxygenase-like lactoylglutathione lyase family enzyme